MNATRLIRVTAATIATVALASLAPTATPAAPKYPQYYIVHVTSQTKTEDTYDTTTSSGSQSGSETIESSYSQDMEMVNDGTMYGITLGKAEGPVHSTATIEGSSKLVSLSSGGASTEQDQSWMGHGSTVANGTQPTAAAGILDAFGSNASGFSARFNVNVPAQTCNFTIIVSGPTGGKTTSSPCDKGVVQQQFDVTSNGHDPSPNAFYGSSIPFIGEAHGDIFNGYTLHYGGTVYATLGGIKHTWKVGASMVIHIASKLKGAPK